MRRAAARWLLPALLLVAGCGDLVRVSGEHAVSERELERVARRPLTSYAQQGGRPADLIDAAEAMRARLDAEGYPAAAVTAEAGTPPLFRIEQGPRAALGAVVCSGDTGLAPDELAAFAVPGSPYSGPTAGRLRLSLLRTLRASGYLQAVVAEPVESWDAGRTRVDLAFAVQAGPRFRLVSSRLELVPGSDPAGRWAGLHDRLQALLDPPGGTFVPRSASAAAARLRGLLLDHGHREAQVTVEQQDGPGAGEVALRFVIRPGPVHILRALSTQGGARSTPRFVAARLEGLQPGRPLAQSALDQSVTGLLSTGLFRRVEALPTTVADAGDGTVQDDVRIEMRELATQHVDFSLGYGSYERFRGGATYVDEHMLGQGLRLSAGVEASTVGYEATASLSDPFRFGPGRRVTLDGMWLERQEPSYSHQEASSGLTFSRRFKPGRDPALWEVRTGYRFTRSRDYRIEAVGEDGVEESLYTTSAVGVELRRDARRPRIIDPDSGTMARAGLAWSAAPLGATVDYIEALAEWSGAWSPAPWLVATVRGACTTRDPGVVGQLPIGERLFMGGSDTVRSFGQDELGPRADNGEPLGGLTSAVANLELRWRPFAELRELEFATFYDLGTVDPDAWSLSAPWGEGVGAGLRYRTPVGPIRFDGAVNPGDAMGAVDRWAVNLTVGFAF